MLLIVAYALSMLFSLKTHRELFASAEHGEEGEAPWPIGLALATLAGVTVLVALVSEVFVESVQKAAESFGMTPAFVGFIVVALVGGAAEMASAFSGARKNRLDMSVGIALGSASQIALFVAPVLVLASYFIGPTPMDLQFWPGAVVMILIATLTAALVTNSGRSAWFVGVLLLMVYLIFALTLYLLPPRAPASAGAAGVGRPARDRRGRTTVRVRPAPRSRLEFETLIAELSSRFVNLPPAEVDREIEDALRRVCEPLGRRPGGALAVVAGRSDGLHAHALLPRPAGPRASRAAAPGSVPLVRRSRCWPAEGSSSPRSRTCRRRPPSTGRAAAFSASSRT